MHLIISILLSKSINKAMHSCLLKLVWNKSIPWNEKCEDWCRLKWVQMLLGGIIFVNRSAFCLFGFLSVRVPRFALMHTRTETNEIFVAPSTCLALKNDPIRHVCSFVCQVFVCLSTLPNHKSFSVLEPVKLYVEPRIEDWFEITVHSLHTSTI